MVTDRHGSTRYYFWYYPGTTLCRLRLYTFPDPNTLFSQLGYQSCSRFPRTFPRNRDTLGWGLHQTMYDGREGGGGGNFPLESPSSERLGPSPSTVVSVFTLRRMVGGHHAATCLACIHMGVRAEAVRMRGRRCFQGAKFGNRDDVVTTTVGRRCDLPARYLTHSPSIFHVPHSHDVSYGLQGSGKREGYSIGR